MPITMEIDDVMSLDVVSLEARIQSLPIRFIEWKNGRQ
jgi:hypothetical protein